MTEMWKWTFQNGEGCLLWCEKANSKLNGTTKFIFDWTSYRENRVQGLEPRVQSQMIEQAVYSPQKLSKNQTANALMPVIPTNPTWTNWSILALMPESNLISTLSLWFESASFFFSLNPDELRGAGRRGCNQHSMSSRAVWSRAVRSWAKDVSRNVSYRLLGGSELSHSFDGRCIVGLGPLGRGYDQLYQLPPPRLQPLQANLPALQRILKKSPKDHPKSKHWIMMGLLLTQVLDWVYSLQHLYHLGLTETNPFQQVCWLYFKWWSNGAPKQFYVYTTISKHVHEKHLWLWFPVHGREPVRTTEQVYTVATKLHMPNIKSY